MPSNCVLAVAGLGLVPLDGSPPSASIWALTCSRASLGTIVPAAKSLSPLSRDLHALRQVLVHRAELELVHHAAGQQAGVADAFDAHLPQHLGDDDLDVLVVDFDALAAVDVLDFADQILLHGFFAGDAEDVVRHQRAVDQRLAGPDEVAGVDAQVLAVRDEVLALDAAFAADDDRPLAAALFAQQLDRAVDLGDDGRVLRLAGLEDFRHAGQTAGDVLRAGHFAGRLGQQRAGGDLVAFVDFDVGLFRQVVEVENLAASRLPARPADGKSPLCSMTMRRTWPLGSFSIRIVSPSMTSS